jgi:hypothetical protein
MHLGTNQLQQLKTAALPHVPPSDIAFHTICIPCMLSMVVCCCCCRCGCSSWRADYNRTDVKHGRFGEDEKATIAAAIREYAEERGLPFSLGEQ